MKKISQLALRCPEAISAARAKGFNEVAVNKLFDLLLDVLEKNPNIDQSRIFNVDETGTTSVPKKMSKIISIRGKNK